MGDELGSTVWGDGSAEWFAEPAVPDGVDVLCGDGPIGHQVSGDLLSLRVIFVVGRAVRVPGSQIVGIEFVYESKNAIDLLLPGSGSCIHVAIMPASCGRIRCRFAWACRLASG